MKLKQLVTLFLGVLLTAVQLAAVNINTANAEALQSLNGIGEKTAQRIIKYRTEHPFKSTSEITNVKGIGEKTFEKIKDDLEV